MEKEEKPNIIPPSTSTLNKTSLNKTFKDYYFMYVWGLVDPEIFGPYPTVEERDKAIEEKKKESPKPDEDTYFEFTATKGTFIDLG